MLSAIRVRQLQSFAKQTACWFVIACGFWLACFSFKGWNQYTTEDQLLSTEQEISLQSITAVPDNTNVAEAAMRVFERQDVYSIRVSRASSDGNAMSIDLRKHKSGSRFLVERENLGYIINVEFINQLVTGSKLIDWWMVFYIGLLILGVGIMSVSLFTIARIQDAHNIAERAFALQGTTDIKVLVKIGSMVREQYSFSKCMSGEFIFLENEHAFLSVYDRVRLSFRLPTSNNELEFTGIVRWTYESGSGPENVGFGIEFLDPSHESIKELTAELDVIAAIRVNSLTGT